MDNQPIALAADAVQTVQSSVQTASSWSEHLLAIFAFGGLLGKMLLNLLLGKALKAQEEIFEAKFKAFKEDIDKQLNAMQADNQATRHRVDGLTEITLENERRK